ncbi:hypothetical protein [Deinococcus sedimenti]|uniref:PKD domain-containing protein n=1 Tax=Deinococcus sedimenti TaxID=1867090 RepID=A0ABQ2S714_9DEIO|nr:hypothetical protein [Deinococcus sedimenti]GGS03882.1 hypothetical protein GCM10008960_33070 [Deinococcus sedimenti]
MNLTAHAPPPDRPPAGTAARGLHWLFTLLVTLAGLQISSHGHAQTAAPTLTVTPTSPTVRQTVTADITNLDPALTYTLDWGDGLTDTLTGSTTAQRTTRYSRADTYTVTLTEPNAPPVTTTVQVGIATPTLTATANRLTATLNIGTVVIDYAYVIDWGDGTTDTTYTNGDPTQVTHDYTQPGTYPIQVTPQGGSTATTTVTVAYPNPILTVTPGSTTVFDTVTADLTDLEPTLTYRLDWGDGSVPDTTTGAATAQKTHAYTRPGTVAVTVTSAATSPVTTTVTVTVPTPTASAAGNGLTATLNLGNLLVGYSYTVTWGDTTESLTATNTTSQLTHTYAQPGTVTITVTPHGSAPVTTTTTLTVPDASLSATPASAPAGQTVTADLAGLTPTLTYTLDWGDGTAAETITGTPTAQKVHAYAQPGTSTITLTSPGTTPVTATVSTTVPTPTVSATSSTLTTMLNLENLLSGYAYSITWGDGTTEALTPTAATAQLTHTYAQPGKVTIGVTPQGGVTVTTTATLSAGTPTLTVTPSSAQIRQTVTATLSGLVPAVTYALDWGDGTTETLTGTATAQRTHTYAMPGTSTVTLTSASTTPVTATVTTTVPAPTARATGNGLTATLNLGNLLSGYAYSITWGDGATETLTPTAATAQLTHTYAQPGTVTIGVTPQGGVTVTTTVTLSAGTPTMTVTPSSAEIRQTVTATLGNLVPAVTYTLDWGDGTTETLTGTATAQRTHTYATPGTFTARLTSNATATVTATVTTTVPTPTVNATSSTLTATLNLGNLLSGYAYSITWGDGSIETLTPTVATAQLTHTYAQPGGFTIQVTPQGGVTVTTTATLSAGTPTMTVAPSSAQIRQTVTATLGNLVPAVTYTLDWGDGTVAETVTGTAAAQKTHTYATPGTFTVTLTSASTTPITATVTTTVPAPTASATGNGLTATLNLGNLLSGYAYSITWGDGSIETLTPTAAMAQLTHTYAQPSTVTIGVTPQGGVTVTTTATLSAGTPTMTVTPSSAQIRQTVTAALGNLVPAVTYTLDWGDGTTQTLTGTATAQRTHTYATPGTFTARLTSNATATVTATVTTTVPAPTASATGNGLTATLNLGNLLSGYAYSINWGDGTTETLTPTDATAQLTHTYAQPGGFTIQVTPQRGAPVATTVTLKLPTATLNVTALRLDAAADLAQLVAGQTYALNWGDGTTDTVTPTGTAARLTHAYAQSGSFTLRLTAQGMTPVNATLSLSAPPALSVEATGLTVTARVSQLVTGLTYTVTWGDGKTEALTATAAQATLTHPYARPGTYAVRVSMSTGERADATVTVTAPAATLSVTPTDVAVGEPVTATLSGLTPGLTYTLAWGDGTTETLTGVATATRTHAFNDGQKYLTGTFAITLSAQGVMPVTALVTVSVPTPTLAFRESDLRVTLTVGHLIPVPSSDYPYSVEWGDGSVQTFVSPGSGLTEILTHEYARNGTYTVTVRNAGGGTPAQGTVTLNYQTPVPTLTFAPSDLRVTVTVGNLMRTTSSVDAYRVDWGDGSTDTFLNPNGDPAVTLVHTYARPGTFRVEVRHPRVSTPVVASVTVSVPDATLTVTPTSAAIGQTITASVTGLYPGQDYVLNWGDGAADTLSGSADAQRTHAYAEAGTSGVTLTLNGSTVASATVTVTIATPTGTAAATAPLTATLNLGNLLPGSEYTVTWEYGVTEVVTATATTASLTHTYPRPGQYGISVLATGSRAAFSTVVTVVAPVPVLTVTPASVTLGTPVTAGLSNLMAGSYSLEWGDGTSEVVTVASGASTAQRSHTYAELGRFTVTLSSSSTVTVTATATVTAPTPVLDVTPATTFVRDAVTARLSTLVPSVTYTLDWGDGTRDNVSGTSTTQKTHAYAQPGSYAVTLGSAQTTPVTATVTATIPTPTATVSGQDLSVILSLSHLLIGDSYTVNWGDSVTETFVATDRTSVVRHTYADRGTFTVQITHAGTPPLSIDVTSNLPRYDLLVGLAATGSATVDLGQTVTAELLDLVETAVYTLNWGDGTVETVTGVTTATRSHVYLTPGLFTISSPGTARSYALTVRVPETSSIWSLTADGLTVTARLRELIPQLTYTLNWGDGSPETTVTGVTTADVTHQYTTVGQGVDRGFRVALKVSGQASSDKFIVLNVTTTIALSADHLKATARISGLEAGLTYALDWGDGTTETVTGTTSAARTHEYALPSDYTVTVRATRVDPASASIAITAQPAVLTVTGGGNTTLTVTARLSGLVPAVRYTVNWGDTSDTVTGQTEVTLTHAYTTFGRYTITVGPERSDRLNLESTTADVAVGLLATESIRVAEVDDSGVGYRFDLSGVLPGMEYIIDYGNGVQRSTTTDTVLRTLYTRSGTYVVTLLAYDPRRTLVPRATLTIQVKVTLQLGRASVLWVQQGGRVLSENDFFTLTSSQPFRVTLDLPFVGEGRVSGRWLIDGQPVRTTTLDLQGDANPRTREFTEEFTEQRPGRHTLTFEYTQPGQSAPVRLDLDYRLDVPETVRFGGTVVQVTSLENANPDGLTGRGVVNSLVVAGRDLGRYTVDFANVQATVSGSVARVVGTPTAVTVDLGSRRLSLAALGDAAVTLGTLSLSRDGVAVSGTVTLPVAGGNVSMALNSTPLDDNGHLLAPLALSGPLTTPLAEDGLTLSANTAILDLSGSRNADELAAASGNQVAPSTDWMGLVFPAANVTVGSPILTSPLTVTGAAAYNVSGFVTTFDVPTAQTDLLGWTVSLSKLRAEVLAGRISALSSTGSLPLPLVEKTMDLNIGWDARAAAGARWTVRANGPVTHTFGQTTLELGTGTWTVQAGRPVADIVFANAHWKIGKSGDVLLSNLRMDPLGNVSLDGQAWRGATSGLTSLYGYPFSIAEVGIERQSSGGYTLGLNGRLEVNSKLPVEQNTKSLFWVNGGKDVRFTTERIHAANLIYDITLDGVINDQGALTFTGGGRLKVLGLLEADAKATFGRTGPTPNFVADSGTDSVGYGSILFHVASGFDNLTVGIKNVEVYELFGGYTVNMDWPNGLDRDPVFRTAGPYEAVQGGMTLSMLVEPTQDTSRQGLTGPPIAPPKTYVRGIITGKGGQGQGGVDLTGDLWVVNSGDTWDRKTPQGRAKLDVNSQGGLLLQGCVGSGGVTAVAGLDCSKLPPLTFGSIIKLSGFLEQYAGARGSHLYVGTRENPIKVEVKNVTSGNGYLMINPDRIRFGVGVSKEFSLSGQKSFFLCTAKYGISGAYSSNLDLGIQSAPFALDGAVSFSAAARASGECGKIKASAALSVTLKGNVHLADNDSYFTGKASGTIDISGIPDITISTDVTLKF